MGKLRICCVASVAVGSVYLVYAVHRSHVFWKRRIHTSETLPSSFYLYVRYLIKAVTRRPGVLHPANKTTTTTAAAAQEKNESFHTMLSCRMDTAVLRKFCSQGGYGWDYPDTDYRDVPLCAPEFLCGRLLLMMITDDGFRLCPAGLVRVCQSLKTFQPIDELKKGPFTLHVRVLVYRQTDAGVEVDIFLCAKSRSESAVWESVLTLLSKNEHHAANRGSTKAINEGQIREPVSVNKKQVELMVPKRTDLLCEWSFSHHWIFRLLSRPAALCWRRSQTATSLWMLSVCLAEIEKHKGVEVITAPINITAQFREPLLEPGKVTISFWEKRCQSRAPYLGFQMCQHGSNVTHLEGLIFRS